VLPLLQQHAEYRALRIDSDPGVAGKNQLMGIFGMIRKTAVAAALLLIAVSSSAFALGLGEIDMQSALNQPFQASIALTSAGGVDLSKVKVSIASAEAHQRAGLSRPRILANFKFKVEQNSRGQAVILVSSTETIHEPFIEFMLELTWPNGHLMRQYTVLVDPPLTMPAAPAIPAAPRSSTPRAMPVVSEPARRSRPSGPATTTARVPAAAGQSASSFGPVKRSETLWTIARQVRPDSGVSMEQMMLALQRANPNAFMNNNINNLKAGATLTIPSREEITSISARDARNEAGRQYQAWKEGQASTPEVAVEEPAPDAVAQEATAAPAVTTESRLQLTAPEDDTIQGAATAGDPQAGDADTGSSNIQQQLALAAESAEANRAQSEELQSRVTELEEQLATMKRLLELKDDQLATMQNAEATAETEDPTAPAKAEQPVAENANPASAQDSVEAEAEAAASKKVPESGGILNKLMDNPILAGLGVLVAMLLGGFLWASARRKENQSIFDDEMTLEKRLEAENAPHERKPQPTVAVSEVFHEPVHSGNQKDSEEGDPLTEADVYLAYGRIQQAEDVLQAALEKTPDDAAMRVKLLEVYHAGGNANAFDREASDFRDTVTEEDSVWLRVAAMGHELSPENELYRAGAVDSNNLDFDMDLTGMDAMGDQENVEEPAADENLGLDIEARESPAEASPGNIEFDLDDLDTVEITYDDAEDDSEGLLDASDEISTKLDLARAYLDMGDPEGARSILDEVMEEGNAVQKDEAVKLIAELA
jgi:pilus assembly protein FimV